MAIWSALGGFVGAYNDSVDAERTAKLKAQAKEETFEDKKRLAEMQFSIRNQNKEKEAILRGLFSVANEEVNRSRKDIYLNQIKELSKLSGQEFMDAYTNITFGSTDSTVSSSETPPASFNSNRSVSNRTVLTPKPQDQVAVPPTSN